MSNIIAIQPATFRQRQKPIKVKAGNVTLNVYPARRHGYYIVPWYDRFGARHTATRSTIAKAEAFARSKAEALGKDNADRQRLIAGLSESEVEDWFWCQEQCNAEGMLLKDAIKQWRQHRAEQKSRADFAHKTCPQLVEELLEAKRAEDAGKRWVEDLESKLNLFAQDFPGEFSQVRADDLRVWLKRLNLSKRTYNNYRTALVALIAFCRERDYLPKDWDELKAIKPYKIIKGVEEIYTPKEIRSWLFTCEKHYPQHLPVVASLAFSGARHCEFCEESDPDAAVLDWRDYHFSTAQIHVTEQVAKSNTGRRYVPMQPNLVQWLEPYVKPRGPVCVVANLTNALARIAEKAKVKFRRNGFRNSYISYRCAVTHSDVVRVSGEAGNSVGEIQDSYRKELTEAEGLEYFGIVPTKADVLPLFAHAKLLANC